MRDRHHSFICLAPLERRAAFLSGDPHSNLLRLGAGFVSPRRSLDLRLTRLWLDYTVATAAVALGLVLALPLLAAMLGARP